MVSMITIDVEKLIPNQVTVIHDTDDISRSLILVKVEKGVVQILTPSNEQNN